MLCFSKCMGFKRNSSVIVRNNAKEEYITKRLRRSIKMAEKKCQRVNDIECVLAWDEVDDYEKKLDAIKAEEIQKWMLSIDEFGQASVDDYCEGNPSDIECKVFDV